MSDFDPVAFQDFSIELGSGAELGLAITLATMMFSVALGLRPTHFSFFRDSPKLFFVGIVCQLVVLPLMTLGLCMLVVPAPSIALGMILVACCPGGNVSNLLVLLAKGDTALSISLTATSSLAAAFLTPISIVFWSGLYAPTAELLSSIDFNTGSFLLQTLAILAVPLALGMVLAHYFPKLAHSMRKPMVLVSTTGLIIITVFAVAKYWSSFFLIGLSVIGMVIIHNGAAFFIGYLFSSLAGAGIAARRAITYEVGIQNAGLGLVILLTQMDGVGGAAIVIGLWGTWHMIAGLMLVVLFRMSARVW